MAIKKTKIILEDTKSSLFDTGISAEKIRTRKIALSRVLEQAKKALEAAEADGQLELAEKLRERVDYLQELLDRADEESIGDGTGTGKDDERAEGELGAESEDDIYDDESEDGAGGDDSDEEDSGKDDSDAKADSDGEVDDTESDSEESSSSDGAADSTEDTEDEDEDSVDESERSEEESDEDTANSDGGSGASVEGDVEGESTDDESEDSGSDSGDAKDTSADGSESSESDEDGGTGDKEDFEDDDYDGSPVKPKTKDGKILKDPFSRSKNVELPPELPKELDIESTLDAAKRILGKLSGEARKGAVAGLKDLIKSRRGSYVENLNTSLYEELKKTLSQMSDDEFNDEISTTMDLVDKVLKIDYSDDLDDRVAAIKRDASSSVSRMELEREDAEHVKDERAALKAREKENEKYRKIKGLRGLESFKDNLFRAVQDQVDQMEDDVETWSALDRRHEDDPTIVKKGHILDDCDADIPSINVYFDQSGSWSNSDIETGKRAISVINEFHENGEIKLNIFYMSAGGIFTDARLARADGRAEGWHAALQHIKDSGVKNVVVLSDSDLDSYEWNNRPTGDNGRTIVDGCVWWLWKDADTSVKAPKELVGRSGNFHYQFKGAY